jgi:hypothetical protein
MFVHLGIKKRYSTQQRSNAKLADVLSANSFIAGKYNCPALFVLPRKLAPGRLVELCLNKFPLAENICRSDAASIVGQLWWRLQIAPLRTAN